MTTAPATMDAPGLTRTIDGLGSSTIPRPAPTAGRVEEQADRGTAPDSAVHAKGGVEPTLGSGSRHLSMAARRARVGAAVGLSADDLGVLSDGSGLGVEQADAMIENAVGITSLPLGIGLHLRVDGRDRLVPMAIEEPSVIAAASHGAKMARAGGGVQTEVDDSRMIGQIQLLDVTEPAAAIQVIAAARAEILKRANALVPCLVGRGGGVVDLEVRELAAADSDDPLGTMLVVHLIVDVQQAMGANKVNTVCEGMAPYLEELTGGRALLRILSNLSDQRLVRASARIPLAALAGPGGLSGPEVARRIEAASVFAERDPYRATTHNKGIMNGIDAVLVAFGQDWRAVEAGAHAYAARRGRYTALARWRLRGDVLEGELELPLAVGVVGGVTTVHPVSRLAHRIAEVASVAELAGMAAAVGLTQNLAALRALATEGIQKGHMRVHGRNLAVLAGAVGREVDQVARGIAEGGGAGVTMAAARQRLQELRSTAAAGHGAARLRARFESLRAQLGGSVEGLLRDVVEQTSGSHSSLTHMCDYHLATGGKRLRALLPPLVAELLGTDPSVLVPFGAACEMLHNATLVHDDLQDGDAVRRGQPSVWRRFGEAQAINLGDAMFYYPLLLLERLTVSPGRRRVAAERLVRETLQVIDGQQQEFALRARPAPSLSEYFAMVEGKTSGLFALPLAGAAELCAPQPHIVEGLAEAARHLGVLFQIQDDVLDLYGDKGRGAAGSDIREGKRSILVVHALQHLPDERAGWLRSVLDRERDETTDDEVRDAIELLRTAGSLTFSLQEVQRRRRQAVEAASRAEHAPLEAMVEALSELFCEPIAQLLETVR